MTLREKLAQATGTRSYEEFLNQSKTQPHEITKFLIAYGGFRHLCDVAWSKAQDRHRALYEEAWRGPNRSRLDPEYKSYGRNSARTIERHLVLDVIQNLEPSVAFYLLTEKYEYFCFPEGTGKRGSPPGKIDDRIFEIVKNDHWSETQLLLFALAKKNHRWSSLEYTHPIEEFLTTRLKKLMDREHQKIFETQGSFPAFES